MFFVRTPPDLIPGLSWRGLYEAGAFAQRELLIASTFRSRANERDLRLRIGNQDLEDFDQQGALSPIAFAIGGYWSGMTTPAIDSEHLVFREEADPRPWDAFEYEIDHSAEVSALYSPWQILYVDDVLRARRLEAPLWMFTGGAEQRERAAEQLRGWAEAQEQVWRGIDEAWRPTVKLLVRLQNRKTTPIAHFVASSICSFSGQNPERFLDPSDPNYEPGHTQSWGQIPNTVRDTLPAEEHPGSACNGHTGFLAGGGTE